MKLQGISILTDPDEMYSTTIWQINRREQNEGAEFQPYAFVKVCPHCLTIWARAGILGEVYQVHAVSCERCNRPDYNAPIPGSLLDSRYRLAVDWDILQDLNEDLIRREFNLHIKAMLNEQSTGNLSPPRS